jgi:hypothetical protein
MFGRSGGGESKSTRTFTETTGSGANAVTKTNHLWFVFFPEMYNYLIPFM